MSREVGEANGQGRESFSVTRERQETISPDSLPITEVSQVKHSTGNTFRPTHETIHE